jgi:TPR repeat protein
VKRDVAGAGKNGSPAAYYHLSLLLSGTAETDADRQSALKVLEGAAEHGHPHAQFEIGRRYEQGDGVQADTREAMLWYERAAAQGNVLAIQRLKSE